MQLRELTEAQLSEEASDIESCSDSTEFCSGDESILDETLLERIQALKDIVPAFFRAKIAQKVSSFVSTSRSILFFAGKTLWVVTTSILLIGTPLVLAIEEEERMIAYDKEFKMHQKAHEVLAPGTSSAVFSASPSHRPGMPPT